MKLNAIASSDAVTQDLVSIVTGQSTLLRQHVEFYTGAGLGTTERKGQGDEVIAGRNINDAYTPKVFNPKMFPVGRKIFGSTARVDVAYELMKVDVPNEMAYHIRRYGIGIVNTFHNLLVNGDESNKDTIAFNGLKVLTAENQIVKAGVNGLKIPMGNSETTKTAQQDFLEKLNETISLCRGSNKVILVGARMLARLNTIAREYIQYTTDSFGKRIATYDMYPLVNIEETGADIIGFNNKVGTATNCTSIYVVSFGEKSDFSFFTVNEGFKVYPMQKVSNFYENMIEFMCDSALFHEKAIARLDGLTI